MNRNPKAYTPLTSELIIHEYQLKIDEIVMDTFHVDDVLTSCDCCR